MPESIQNLGIRKVSVKIDHDPEDYTTRRTLTITAEITELEAYAINALTKQKAAWLADPHAESHHLPLVPDEHGDQDTEPCSVSKTGCALQSYCFAVTIQPVSQLRPRVIRRGGKTLNPYPCPNQAVPVRLTLAFHLKGNPISRPDLDKLAGAVLDALNGIACEDDSQVAVLVLKKARRTPPSVAIKVEELPLSKC